jgi:hypothetical protein
MAAGTSIVPAERIMRSILLIRGEKVILDADIAALYGVATKILVRAMKRNVDRFPSDFMFQLSKDEFDNWRSQFGTSSSWGGRRYAPYAFTEQGVAMLSSVLKSKRAVRRAVRRIGPDRNGLSRPASARWVSEDAYWEERDRHRFLVMKQAFVPWQGPKSSQLPLALGAASSGRSVVVCVAAPLRRRVRGETI